MTTQQSKRYEMLQRVSAFGQKHGDLFPAQSFGRDAFEMLDVAVTQLREQAASKQTLEREGRQRKRASRKALTVRLENIARAARAIGKDHPGFDEPFHIPRPRSDEKLLTTGHAFVARVEAVKARFASYGMADDFVTSLHALVAEFEAARRGRDEGRAGHTAARAFIESALTAALTALRRLDVIVPNRLERDPVTLAVWKRERKVDPGRKPRKAAAPVDAGAEAPPDPATPPHPVATETPRQAA